MITYDDIITFQEKEAFYEIKLRVTYMEKDDEIGTFANPEVLNKMEDQITEAIDELEGLEVIEMEIEKEVEK